MIIIKWGPYVPPIKLQWADLAAPTVVEQQKNTPNPIAVLIATSGTAAPVNWAGRDW